MVFKVYTYNNKRRNQKMRKQMRPEKREMMFNHLRKKFKGTREDVKGISYGNIGMYCVERNIC